jgi:predicted aspartyl protease
MMSATLINPGMRPDTITLETEMGRVVTSVLIENLADRYEVTNGQRLEADVRLVKVDDALVDTGCTLVGLPTRIVLLLGLQPLYKSSIRGATGTGETTVYGTARLTIQGRSCPTDVFEVPDGIPVLIGQVPLEQLDFVVDPKNQKLIGNPLHGGEHVIEAY